MFLDSSQLEWEIMDCIGPFASNSCYNLEMFAYICVSNCLKWLSFPATSSNILHLPFNLCFALSIFSLFLYSLFKSFVAMRSFLFHLCQLCWLCGILIHSIHFLMLHEFIVIIDGRYYWTLIVYQVVVSHHSNPMN